MVLSDRDIRHEIELGRIIIKPLGEACIQPASVDIRLAPKILIFKHWASPYTIDLKLPLDGLVQPVDIPRDEPFSLQPGHFVLGSTVEYIVIPNDLMARLEGKSSLGRIGLLIHSTAGYVDPGWQGHLTLELYNVAPLPILLYPGMKISQISFQRLTSPSEQPYGTPGLGSKYQGQTEPTATRFHEEFRQASLLSIAAEPIRDKTSYTRPEAHGLSEWLEESQFQGNVKRLAEALGAPVKTVQDWVYRGAKPSRANRAKLFALTELPEFQVSEAGEKPSLLPDQ